MASSAKKSKTDHVDMEQRLAEHRLACAKDVREFQDSKHGASFKTRVRVISGEEGRMRRECKGVLYWMWRDKRVQDNWALLYSQLLALELNVPLHVAVCVPPSHAELTLRHYTFLLEGLQEVAKELQHLDIGFHLLAGEPQACLTTHFLDSLDIGLVVADFSPLREPRAWLAGLEESLGGGRERQVALHQVDAHNVVPVWVTSEKQEYAARTIRPKIEKRLGEYLTPFPPLVKHPVKPSQKQAVPDFAAVYASLAVDSKGWGVEPVTEFFPPGTRAGLANLQTFIESRLKSYASRNDPNVTALSAMSPWVNHGQVSMQRAVLYAKAEGKSYSSQMASFVEEAIVRKELSDNFCYYNPHYDCLLGASDWAQKTLKDHKKDKRDYLYTREELEEGRTHDDLWNASQLQLVREGKLHGFLRMYWAKKILEWTDSPETALKEGLRLNDRYALDGNDPNGFVGVMWSVAGIHDQGWAERAVFGKIRYMNYAGCKRKFDVNKFVLKYGAKVHGKTVK